MSETTTQAADALVIFGITGDLARKMTFGSLYRLKLAGHLHCPIIGVARDDWSEEHLVASVRETLQVSGDALKEKVFKRLVRRFTYLRCDFNRRARYLRRAGSSVEGRHQAAPCRSAWRAAITQPTSSERPGAITCSGPLRNGSQAFDGQSGHS